MTTWVQQQRVKHGDNKVRVALAKLTDQQVDNALGDREFALWLAFVDRAMLRVVGVTHRDIGDWTWRDAFDEGLAPSAAAREALENDDLYASLMGGLD